MRFIAIVGFVLAASCAAAPESRYTATYSSAGSSSIARLAVEATEMQGFKIADAKVRAHDFLFMTFPVRTDPANPIEASFMVQIVFELETLGRKRFTVTVFPKAYENGKEVSEDRLPAGAQKRARALAKELRVHARGYEAPSI